MRYVQYPFELTTQVNESHFISQSWNSYLNITEMNNGKLGWQEFPSIVTCTRDPLKPTRTGLSIANSDLCRRSGPLIPGCTIDGKLKNKRDHSARAFCICKVGNTKFFAMIALISTSSITILMFTMYFMFAKC